MQETIKLIMDAEQKASAITAEARSKASELISVNNNQINEKLSKIREKELNRFNDTVKNIESDIRLKIEAAADEDDDIHADIDLLSDLVLKRVMKTVFD